MFHSRFGLSDRRRSQIGLHSILSFTHEDYGRATSISRLTGGQLPWSSSSPVLPDGDFVDERPPPTHLNGTRRANATLLMLARNSDVEGALRSVRELEDRFNHKFGYPWTFLNEEPFSDEFKRCVSVFNFAFLGSGLLTYVWLSCVCRRVGNVVSSPATFGLIPREHWYQPDWIDEERASASRQKMVDDNIIYGGAFVRSAVFSH